jgi:hypothetical protein
MRRKTAPKDPVHPELLRAAPSEVGLIAKAEESAQSAVGEYVLDNRSHRTIALIERHKGQGDGAGTQDFPPAKAWTAPHPLQPIVRPQPPRLRQRFTAN